MHGWTDRQTTRKRSLKREKKFKEESRERHFFFRTAGRRTDRRHENGRMEVALAAARGERPARLERMDAGEAARGRDDRRGGCQEVRAERSVARSGGGRIKCRWGLLSLADEKERLSRSADGR